MIRSKSGSESAAEGSLGPRSPDGQSCSCLLTIIPPRAETRTQESLFPVPSVDTKAGGWLSLKLLQSPGVSTPE